MFFYLLNNYRNKFYYINNIYWICVITRCAETGCVPPTNGVIVSAVALSAGFLTVKTELIVVVIITNPIIWLVHVALPTTVYANGAPFNVNCNWPASVTLTWNKT